MNVAAPIREICGAESEGFGASSEVEGFCGRSFAALADDVGISYDRDGYDGIGCDGNGYDGIRLGRVIGGLCSFTGHVGFRSECEFVILSKLGMSELRGNT